MLEPVLGVASAVGDGICGSFGCDHQCTASAGLATGSPPPGDDGFADAGESDVSGFRASCAGAGAVEFATDYNLSLAEYRGEAGIASNMRPMPDLHVTEDTVEVPFWLDYLATGWRKRAEVRKRGDVWCLVAEHSEFPLRPDAGGEEAADEFGRWLREHQLRLSPRALTLTTFLRLLVVDQFIHGIGGGRYDQVTDRLLLRHFKIGPPHFAVATGTLFFPGAVRPDAGVRAMCCSGRSSD